MKISGFTMVKNATLLYYPIRQSIESILPLVDEYVIALGEGEQGDETEAEILSIKSDKIKIIKTVWDLQQYPNGTENAHQTDIAKAHCSGDWLFYLQADEVVHEQDIPIIKDRCESFLHDAEVEGLLFEYIHFWGDYWHYQISHGWYKNEIRIIRNRPDIHSWESAQSFRRIPDFDGKNYRQQAGTYKLKVAKANARIYHYGWVRPPHLMQSKKIALDTIHKGREKVDEQYRNQPDSFDYGPLQSTATFKGTHPVVMRSWITKFHWQAALDNALSGKVLHKHQRLKYRFMTFLEQYVLGGREIFGFKNYQLLDR